MRGSVIKRGGSYSAVLDLGRDAATGKRRRMWHSGYHTRKDAEKARTALLADLDRGGYVEPQSLTFGAYLTESWLPAVKVRLDESTWSMYETNIRAHITPELGGLRLQRLSAPDLNVFYARLLANGRRDGRGGLSERTVRIQHVIIHAALKDAVDWDLVPRNVADKADPPAGRSKEKAIWSPEQVGAFLNHCAGDRLAAMWRLAATTGARRAEIAALLWADVDLDRDLVTLWRDPKTRTSKRTISLDAGTVAGLRAHRARQATERLAAGPLWQDSGAVFTMEDGRPVATDYLTRLFGRKVIEAGLPVITLHGLRHAYATMLLRAGEPIRVVSQRIGHATPNITLAVYAHVLPGDDSRAADRGAALLDGG